MGNQSSSPFPSDPASSYLTTRVQEPINKMLNKVASFASSFAGGSRGGLANKLVPGANGGIFNVASNKEYKWTLSNVAEEDIPYVALTEWLCEDTQIQRQIKFYAEGFQQAASSQTESMAMYNEIFPKDNPTGFTYRFPYFNKKAFELSSPDWQQIDSIGDSIKKIGSSISDRIGQTVGNVVDTAKNVSTAALLTQYPSVGVVDRPKVFMSHQDRSITISFMLFNTLNPNDWQNNKNLAMVLMSQNLFNKRDNVSGVPPVFYDVHIPNQYYSYASAMTNINIEHVGNQRLIDGNVVPDAFSFELTLTELVKPSKNQLQALMTGYVNKVQSRTAS